MDALSNFKDTSGGGLFLRFRPDEPVKLRILTNDPVVNKDKWGNTRYSFVVWNHTENLPQILSKGMSILKQLQEIHTSDDWGNDLRKVDIKITSTGQELETRYTVMPLPNSQPLTRDQIEAASKIKLDEVIKFGIRLSDVNEGTPVPEPEAEIDSETGQDTTPAPKAAQTGYTQAKEQADQLRTGKDVVVTDVDGPIDLDSIPW